MLKRLLARFQPSGRATSAAVWTILGFGTQKVLAFITNLVLTRLLAPDAFGLMTLAGVFLIGLEMLSDVGTGQAIVQSTRGDDSEFLDTAWSVQIVRGAGLCLCAELLAWPVSRIYDEPRLIALLCVSGAGPLIRGFSSMRAQLHQRRVMLGRVTAWDLSCQVATTVATVAIAWRERSVWALVLGSLVGDAVRVALTFIILPGPKHHFRISKNAAREIVRIGRWVIWGTAFTYASGYLDRLVLGRLISIRLLGIYGVASMIVLSITYLGKAVGTRVLFPILAETIRTSPAELHGKLRKARIVWIASLTSILSLLTLTGSWLIRQLYATNYHEAGWMLRVLSFGAIAAVINQSSSVLWQSLGEFRTATLLSAIQVPALLMAMIVGRVFWGYAGAICGCATVEFIMYPLQAYLLAKRGFWQPKVDLPVLIYCGVLAAGSWIFNHGAWTS